MEIKNLAQLKRAISSKQCFVIKQHFMKPECTGQTRQPNVIQTNGFYSIIKDNLDHEVSLANNCRGSWLPYGKAKDWTFTDGTCRYAPGGKPVWEIIFI